jgi:3-dehydroquinate dehydratase II
MAGRNAAERPFLIGALAAAHALARQEAAPRRINFAAAPCRGVGAPAVRETSTLMESTMTARLTILNGPNLNLLGVREPHIYGSTTLEAVKASCEEFANYLGASLAFHQSNYEGELVELIQQSRGEADALIINPAAYSFTSIAMLDALKIFEGPIFEVHISNIHARDELHRHSILSSAVKAVICGLGPYGYLIAMQAALHALGKLPATMPAVLQHGPRAA